MSHTSAAKPPRSASRYGCLFIVLHLLLLSVVIAASVIGWNFQVSRQVASELAQLRADGEPTNAEELAAFYDYPLPDKDVTKLWLDATEPLTGEAFYADFEGLPVVGIDPIPPLHEPWRDLPAVEKVLAKHRPPLEKLHEAARRGGAARYPVDFEAGLAPILSRDTTFQSAARLLMLEAHARARRGDGADTVESIEAILSLAESLQREPSAVSQFTRVNIDCKAFATLEPLLPSGPFTDADLARLQSRFREIDYDDGFLRMMLGERVFGLIAIQTMSLDDNRNDPDGPVPLPLRNENTRVYLEWIRRAVDAARKPLPQRLAEADAVDAEFWDEIASASPMAKLRLTAAKRLMVSLSTVLSVGAKGNAQMRLAATGIAVERFRRKHGKFPDRLEQLVPEFLAAIPGDPFDGRPLRYVVRDGRAIVYSVGQDHVDDGGQGDPNLEKSDIVFTLNAPNRPSSPPKR